MVDPGSEKQLIKKHIDPFWPPRKVFLLFSCRKTCMPLNNIIIRRKKPNTICLIQGIKRGLPNRSPNFNKEQQNFIIEFAMLVTMIITIILLKVLNQGTQK